MTLPAIDWIAVGAGLVAAMIIGSLWYSPILFFKRWLVGIEKSEAQLGNPVGPMVLMLLMAALKVICVVVLMGWLKIGGIGGGLTAALFIWVAAIFPTQAMEVAFENRPKILYVVNLGHSLLSQAVIGIVVGLFIAAPTV